MTDEMILSLAHFCEQRDVREGTLGPRELPRFAELAIDDQQRIRWRAEGALMGRAERPQHAGRPTLKISIDGSIRLRCVRCLTSIEIPLTATQRFIAFATDDEADGALIDDDEFDAIVGSERFDLRALLEDEVLLVAMPLALHAQCPPEALSALGLESDGERLKRADRPPGPFDVLKAVKKG